MKLAECIKVLLVSVFRLFPVAVLLMVLYLPAHKSLWVGYVPIAAAILLVWVMRRLRLAALVSGRSERVFVTCLIGVPVVLQLTMLLILRPVPALDGLFVYQQAVEFFKTGNMSELTYYAPAQIWWYAVWFRVFEPSYLVAQVSHLPLMACLVYVSYSLAKRTMSLPAARLVGLALALYPSYVFYVLVTPYYFYLYAVMMVLIATAWWSSQQAFRAYVPFIGGVAAGLGTLTKAVLLVAPVQGLLFWVLVASRGDMKKTAGSAALFILGMALVISPWTYRNLQVFGECVLVNTSGGMVLYSANNPESDGLYSELPDREQFEDPEELWAYSKQCSEKAKAFILGEPVAFARLAWNKMIHTWGTETTFTELINVRGETYLRLDQLLSLIVQTAWVVLVISWVWVAVRLLMAGSPASNLEVLVAVIVLSHAFVYLVYEGGSRHHLPLVPMMLIYIFSWRPIDLQSK